MAITRTWTAANHLETAASKIEEALGAYMAALNVAGPGVEPLVDVLIGTPEPAMSRGTIDQLRECAERLKLLHYRHQHAVAMTNVLENPR